MTHRKEELRAADRLSDLTSLQRRVSELLSCTQQAARAVSLK